MSNKLKSCCALAVMLVGAVPTYAARRARSCDDIANWTEGEDAAALFYPDTSRGRRALRNFKDVEERADDSDADIEFIRVDVSEPDMVACTKVYDVGEGPLLAVWDDKDPGRYAGYEGKMTEDRMARFIERNTGEDLRAYRDYYYDRGPRVRFGIGVGTGLYGRPWRRGWGGGWYGHRGHRGHRGGGRRGGGRRR